jgi:hypothetical protein
MGGGNDTLLQDNVYILDSEIMDTGEGADVVRWNNTSANFTLTGDLGNGDNSFFGSRLVAGGIGIRAGVGGNSMAVLFSASSGNLNLDSSGGVARFYVDTCFVAGEVHGGTGFSNNSSATFNVFRCGGFEVDVSGGSGDDSVNIYGNQVMRLDVQTHNGHDAVDVSYNVCPQGIYVILGAGDDTVIATGNFTPPHYYAGFDGTEGFDRLTLIGNQFALIFTNSIVIV